MRILVVGGGGREHAIVWKLAHSNRVDKIFCAPGNAGIARLAECINLKPGDLEGLANFADSQRVDLTVVGPEGPLVAGIVDRFEARGLPIFGPSTDPARIEGSKGFAKELMYKYDIPTAKFWKCTTVDEARLALREYYGNCSRLSSKVVVKADGLAGGKGVVIAESEANALDAIDKMMVQRLHGHAGSEVVIEEFLEGEEASIMAFTDGDTVVPMPASQDHKRIFDDDLGPNTGGMGAYTPVPAVTPELAQTAYDKILVPAVSAIRDLGIPYKGVLYAGIILTETGPKTLEFNCRFGDPEAQAILPLLETDLLDVLSGVVNSELASLTLQWKEGASACVVASSKGYPGEYELGFPIRGLDSAADVDDCVLFHSGTKLEDGEIVTDGGRVLSVTGMGGELPQALSRAYSGMKHVSFEGIYYRHDIAHRALERYNST